MSLYPSSTNYKNIQKSNSNNQRGKYEKKQ